MSATNAKRRPHPARRARRVAGALSGAAMVVLTIAVGHGATTGTVTAAAETDDDAVATTSPTTTWNDQSATPTTSTPSGSTSDQSGSTSSGQTDTTTRGS